MTVICDVGVCAAFTVTLGFLRFCRKMGLATLRALKPCVIFLVLAAMAALLWVSDYEIAVFSLSKA